VDDHLDKEVFEIAHDLRMSKSQFIREAVKEKLANSRGKFPLTIIPTSAEVKKNIRKSFLQFGAFRNRAKKRGLPSTLKTWLRYEAKGLVKFRKLPTGRRIFNSMREIDDLLDKFMKQ